MNDSDFDTDYDGDFDSEFESHEERPDSLEDTATSVDRVADILLGGSGDGPPVKEKRTDFSTRNVDGDGRPTYDRKTEEAPSFANNRSAPDLQSAQARIDHVDATSQQVMKAWEELQSMQGDLPPEVFAERQQYLQGQAAGLTIQRQAAVIEQMKLQLDRL